MILLYEWLDSHCRRFAYGAGGGQYHSGYGAAAGGGGAAAGGYRYAGTGGGAAAGGYHYGYVR